ncbi:hypothetical protein M378DRAFT_44488, partial [Amanita muscaria Koide BX008]
LINVTGKPGKFRAVDWYVELHNMRIKVRFLRMSGPNRTIKRIITESPLVGNYKSVQQIVQRNFLLVNETTAHCEANLDKTFSELLLQYKESSLHVFTPGRKTTHIIDDLLSRG